MSGLIGARAYEVIFNWAHDGRHPQQIVAVWKGELAIHGGLILGPLVGIALAARWSLPVLQSLDAVAPSVALGQAIGRWGNVWVSHRDAAVD